MTTLKELFNSGTYTDADAIDAINSDVDHGSTAQHDYYADSDAIAAINGDIDHGSTAQHDYYADSDAIAAINGDTDHGSTANHDNLGTNEIRFSNIETVSSNDGAVGFDSSEGLMVYRTQQPGDASGSQNYLVLDGANIVAGTGISISGGVGSDGGPVTFSVDQSGSFSQDGYTVLPGGLYIQWGVTSQQTFNQGSHSISFPTTFPNAIFTILTAIYCTSPDVNGSIDAYPTSTSRSGATFEKNYSSSGSETGYIHWMAIGY